MLRKLSDTVFYDLLLLMAALVVAVGMPLLHPAIHGHPVDHLTITGRGSGHEAAFIEESHERGCLICDFLAAAQWYGEGAQRVLAQNELTGEFDPLKNVFRATTCPLQIEPRAPPYVAPF